MLSRAATRVGLEWRPPPCPEPSRLDDWFLGVVCAGSQHSAPVPLFPEVHGELTGCGWHILLPETDLLAPPPSPPSVVVQLGGIRGPRVQYPSTRQGKPCFLFRACRYSSGLSGDAYVTRGEAANCLRYGVTAGSSG